MSGHRVTLVLGPMPAGADPAACCAAGPWCFAGQEAAFPGWERAFTFAPEPLDSPEARHACCAEIRALCADMLPQLAEALCPWAGELPAAYWETLLAPWAVAVARQVVERWWRVRALLRAWGERPLHVPLLPPNCAFQFASGQDFILHGALGQAWNHWLLSRILEAVFPHAWTREYLPPVSLACGEPPARGMGARLRDCARGALLRLPFPRLKGMTLAQSLRLSLALLTPSRGPDRSTPLAAFSGEATGVRPDLPCAALPFFLAALPADLRALRHPRRLTPSPAAPRLRVASVAAYENLAYRRRLALWRGRGHRLMYVQHGCNYGQTRELIDAAVVEYTQHAFATWGWTRHGEATGHFVPLPYPQLAAAQRRWRGEHGTDMLYVGAEIPAFPYRPDVFPPPTAMLTYREDKAHFFAALTQPLRDSALYRPYFPVPGALNDADWLRGRVPCLRLATGPLAPHLWRCRMLVLDHNGTTLLEAMAANMPMVAFWRRELWPLCPEADELLDMLAQAGVWHSTPEAAAAHAARVWDNPLAWWLDKATQDARRAYVARQALLVTGNPLRHWLQALARL